MENIKIWASEMENYKLLDSGEKEKLEEIGGIKIIRKEPRAWWRKSLPENEWEIATTGLRQDYGLAKKEFEKVIDAGVGGIKAKIKFSESSKHIGIFPEQFEQWKWIEEKIKRGGTRGGVRVLNLFGYTGIASLVAAQSGARVTHVDASKPSVDWARENQKLSGLQNAPIRWIVDDVVKFLKREIKREKNLPDRMGGYDAIIMDPPSYGKGPKGEVWKIEDKLPELLKACREILSDNPLFVIFNMYSTELSSISVSNLLSDMMNDLSGKIECGELAIKPSYASVGRQQNSEKILPMSIFAIWQS